MGNQQPLPEQGKVQRLESCPGSPGDCIVYSPNKYRETEGIKDYDSPGTANLTQYRIIDLEDNTPATYERVFKSSGELMLPRIDNSGGAETENDDGSKTFTFEAGSGTGYRKSTIVFSAGADTGSGSAYVSIRNTASGFRVVRSNDYGIVETAIYTALDITYNVSKPPSGGGTSGSVTVHPVTKYNQKAIIPASATVVAPTPETITVLAQSTAAAPQNFAFDGMEDITLDDYS